MAPLVPVFFSPQFELILAFFIGVAFGFVLEQAGFGSSRRLVGLFYGYDFTVLRVFFTAGITAMVGVLLLGHLGLLDLGLIYVNPTFVRAALLGGGIMGLGFVIGGFCPGTSICAAVSGKVDAMAFVLGATLGVFAFMETLPWMEGVYLAQNMGQLRISDLLGVSPNIFALGMIAMAVGAFVLVDFLEFRRASAETLRMARQGRILVAAITVAVVGFVLIVPSHADMVQLRLEKARTAGFDVPLVPADQFARELANAHDNFNLIDVRSAEEYEAGHLPLAINLPLDQMQQRGWRTLLTQRERTNVYYADDPELAAEACTLADLLGRSDNKALRETRTEFNELFFSAEAPSELRGSREAWRSRRRIGEELKELDETAARFSAPVKVTIEPAKGGCS